jgi:hypothetical protein
MALKGPVRKVLGICPVCKRPVYADEPHGGKPAHHGGACGLAAVLDTIGKEGESAGGR